MQTYSLKFVLVGDSGIGKSQLLRRFCKKEFIPEPKMTLNMEFSTRDIPFERCIIKAQIWDTVGQERFESLTKAYYRDALGALLVYDVNSLQSFENAKTVWLKQLRAYGHERLHIVLVGNKADEVSNESKREVSCEEATEFAKANGMDFAETSALINANVEPVFRRVILNVAIHISAINEHLGLTDLPEGWIHVSRTADGSSSPVVARSPDTLELIKKNDNSEEVEKYINFWTGDITQILPVAPADSPMIYIADRRAASVTAPSFYRSSLSVNSGKGEEDLLRIAGEDDVDVDSMKGKCNNCTIL